MCKLRGNNMNELKDFIDEMRSTSSSTEKVQIIQNSSPTIHKVIEYTYNPFKQYFTTSKTCHKNKDKVNINGLDLFDLLDRLIKREVTGHDSIALINGFSNDLIFKIIDKDLGIRVG